MSNAIADRWVGRGGFARPDPLGRFVGVFDADQLRGLDALATFHGASLGAVPDDELQAQMGELGDALDSSLNFDRAATSLREREAMEEADRNALLAEEHLRLVEGRALAGHQPQATEKALADAREALQTAKSRLIEAYTAFNPSGYHLDADGNLDLDYFYATLVDDAYHFKWFDSNDATLGKIIAIERELTVRDERELLEARGLDRTNVAELTVVKEIGTDASGLLAERAMRETGWNRRLQRPNEVRIYRTEVPSPPLLTTWYDPIGERRHPALMPQHHMLAPWLAERSDEWIETRFAELRNEIPDREQQLLYDAYGHEREIRRQLEVAEAVERTFEDAPSDRVVKRLGRLPDEFDRDRLPHYFRLTQRIETRHLDGVSAAQDPYARTDYSSDPTLDRDVDAYRAEVGMEPSNPAVEASSGYEIG